MLSDNKKLSVGTVLVPKKERKHLFQENTRYVVTQEDIDANGEIGDYWEIEKNKKCKEKN